MQCDAVQEVQHSWSRLWVSFSLEKEYEIQIYLVLTMWYVLRVLLVEFLFLIWKAAVFISASLYVLCFTFRHCFSLGTT